jgi:ATP/maltotriose-dependent transcriptional regulator MalT
VPSAAVTYLRRALEEPPAPASKPQLMLELGRAEVAAGKPEAKDRLAAAVRLIDEPGDRARAALEAGWALYSEGRPEDAADAFAQGAEGLGDADPDLRVQLEVARAASRRLVGSARDGDDDELRLDLAGVGPGSVELVLAYRAFEGTLTGRHREEVVGDARDALHGREEAESEAAEGLGYYLATFALVAGGELTAAERFLSAGVEHARSRGSVLGFATASFLRSQSRLRYGDLDGALADARTALSARRYGWKLGLLGAHAVVINALIEKDDLDGAGEEVAAASEAALAGDDLAQGMYLAARGHWHLHRGAPEEALADFEAVGERERTLRASNPAVLSWRSGAALALSKLGEAETAAGLAHEELGMGRAFGSAGQLGRTLHALGSLQENGRRLEVLGEAVQALDRSEARLDLARALVDYGAALRRARKRAKAREPLRRGLDLAERCGAAALGQRARDELVTAGARPRRAALTGVEALTERERQVVDLAAQGMSNKDIAEALFVTLKTVEWHLHHAYRKLGVSSRTELTEILTPRQ